MASKLNSKQQVSTKTPAARARKARARARRRERDRVEADLGRDVIYGNAAQRARSRTHPRSSRVGASRFGFGFENVDLGPVKIGKGFLGMGRVQSGSKQEGGTVGLAPRSQNVQVIMPQMRTYQGEHGEQIDLLSGTEFVASVASGASGNNPGDILEAILISPQSFAQTRLFQFSPLYQRYRFLRINFLYEPTANATQSGQLIGFTDYDVDSPLVGDSAENVSIAAAHFGQQVCQIWEGQTFPFGVVDDLPMLYTSVEGEEDRLIYQGLFYLLASTSISGGLPLGNLYIEYECEFSIPQLSPSVVPNQLLCCAQDGGTGGLSLQLPFGSSTTDNFAIWSAMLGLPALREIDCSYTPGSGTSTFLLTGLPSDQTFYFVCRSPQFSVTTGTNSTTVSWQISITGDAQAGAPTLTNGSFVNVPVSTVTGNSSIIYQSTFTTTNIPSDGYVQLVAQLIATGGSPTINWNTSSSGRFTVMAANTVSPNSLPSLQVLSGAWLKKRGDTKGILPRHIRQIALTQQEDVLRKAEFNRRPKSIDKQRGLQLCRGHSSQAKALYEESQSAERDRALWREQARSVPGPTDEYIALLADGKNMEEAETALNPIVVGSKSGPSQPGCQPASPHQSDNDQCWGLPSSEVTVYLTGPRAGEIARPLRYGEARARDI